MDDRHAAAVAGVEDAEHLGGEPDLGKENDDSPSSIQHPINGLQNHAGLAAAGHSVEKGGLGLSRGGQRFQGVDGGLLLPA